MLISPRVPATIVRLRSSRAWPCSTRPIPTAKLCFAGWAVWPPSPCGNSESVNFFVRDDAGGRLEEIVCQPATREDLEGPLADDLAELKDRLARAKAETPGEEALLKSVRQSLGQLLDDPNRTDLDSYFFRYRDATGRWRLVWCWGFQRSDGEPAPAVVCTDPDCNLLFVRRPKQSPKCPSCALLIAERKAQRRSPVGLLSLLLLLILLGLAVGGGSTGRGLSSRPRSRA